MSINWVMLDPTPSTPGSSPYIRLPHERPIFQSSPRTALSITTPRTYPGNDPLSITSNSGILYLTNQRVIYLPAVSTEHFKSFSAPILNLHDTHVVVPWFGPNAWQAYLQPIPGGGIAVGSHAAIEVKITFKEGGVTEFHSAFERIKERLAQVVEVAGMDGRGPGNVNLEAVHLEQLPSYEMSGFDRVAGQDGGRRGEEEEEEEVARTQESSGNGNGSGSGSGSGSGRVSNRAIANSRTTETNVRGNPPGYEETQAQSLQEEMDRRLSH